MSMFSAEFHCSCPKALFGFVDDIWERVTQLVGYLACKGMYNLLG